MPLFQLLGCENILVFVVEQMKTENLMGGVATFIRSTCNEYKTMAMVRYQTQFFLHQGLASTI
jgi:hypothetical protein